ncbi:MAG: beta-ketoacyl synthase chain length factor [Pseudomonadota bacterium]|nr:beta-ketoacyl synthase chain length factor [Pseudomonadota bacterium]
MSNLRFCIDGIAFWSPGLPGWPIARAAFRGDGLAVEPPAKRPAPAILAPAERRRAPDSVALALEVASAAMSDAGRLGEPLPSVFTSAHGDLAVSDYMCATLASQPTLISPTRFHNSVHNAAAGYWTIGTGCMAASSAVTAFTHSFGAGLLEAASQCLADDVAVLLVAFDVNSVGALVEVASSKSLLAGALVLTPVRASSRGPIVSAELVPGRCTESLPRSSAARALQGNGMAGALPLFEALALGSAEPLDLPLSASQCLRVVPELRP